MRYLKLIEEKLLSANEVDRITDISYKTSLEPSNHNIIRALDKYNQALHLIFYLLICL